MYTRQFLTKKKDDSQCVRCESPNNKSIIFSISNNNIINMEKEKNNKSNDSSDNN